MLGKYKIKFLNTIAVLACCLNVSIDIAQTTTTYSSSTTWTVPCGGGTVTVYCWGGGGGGGGGAKAGPFGSAGGGGGGGACATKTFAVTAGQTYTITVGAGGTGGLNTGGAGGIGGTSYFIGPVATTTVVAAVGGNGGQSNTGGGGTNEAGGTGGAAASCTPSAGAYSGGTGQTSYDFYGGCGTVGTCDEDGGGGGGGAGSGAAGGGGYINTAGNPTVWTSANSKDGSNGGAGGTGTFPGGAGGSYTAAEAAAYEGAGGVGNVPGGGGAGSADANLDNKYTGGAGAAGQVVVVFTQGSCSTLTLGSNAPSAANECASTTSVIIEGFSTAVTVGAGNLTDVSFTTTGTYAAADLSNFKLWYNASNTFGTATLLSTIALPAVAGTQIFPTFSSPTLNNGSTYYFWITCDVASSPTDGHTIAVNGISTGNLTSTSSLAGGPTAAGGTQTLKASPVSNAGSNQLQCSNSTFTLAANNPSAGSGAWTCSSGCGGVTITTPSAYNSTVTGVAAGTPTTLTWTVSNTGCSSATSNVTLTNNTQPAAVTVSTTGTYCSNTTLTAAGGAPGTMYWENITSGGTSTATPSSSQSVSSSGTYYYGSDNNGCWTYGSATVTINTPISITTQPSSTSQTVCQLSTPTTLSVTVSGTSPAYQWYQNAANSNVGGSSIAGANSNTYTPSSSTIGTLYYYCIITSPAPCSSSVTTSVSGAVNITSAPSAITVSTAGTYCTNTTLTATGGAGGTMYWENTTSNGTSTATPSTSQLVSSTGTYYFGSYNGSCWTYGSATITINTAVNITTQPSTTTQNGGVNFAATALTVTATGTGLSYQWYSNASNSNSGGTSLGSANGGQTNTYTPQTGSIGTLYYYCVVSGASPCGSVTSNVSGAVIVSPIPNAPVASAATYIDCNSIFANWAASSGATSYYLDVSPNNTFSSFVTGFNNVNVGNTTSDFVYNLTAGTTYYYRVRANNSSGTSGNSNTITFTTSAAGSCAGSWVALGTGNAVHGNGTNGIVYALTTSWPLKLYVGGSFSDVYNSTGGTVAASNVALWTATPGSSAGTWTALTGGGVNGQINALAFNPNAGTKGILYVGGQFTIACTTGTNVAVSNLAQYDVGTGVWSNVGGGVTGGAAIGYAYQQLDGGFSLSDQTANSNCTCTGGGFPVQALAVDASGNLYVGGNFTTAGTGGGAVSATNIAEFHPSSAGSASGTWYKLPSSGTQGVTGSVYATSNTYYTAPTVYALNIDQSGNVWVGGQFTTAGSINANNIAEWIPTGTGTGTWYALGSGTTTTTQGVLTEAYGNASGYYQQFSEAPGVFSIVSNGTTIYVGGDFASVNGTGTSVAYNLAQWTVSGAGTGTWSYVGTASNHQGVQGPSFDGAEVNALYYSSPFLYIGGDFQDANNSALVVNNAAMWSGATFAEMPTGSTPGFDPAFFTAYAIAGLSGVGPNDAGVLYMGGYNTPNPYTASMTEVNSIVQWGDPDVVLPIKILTFNAQYNPDGNVVDLNWETATEVNNKEFIIEKTLDGTNWAFVANIKGAGTSSMPISYASIDEQPYSGTSYYRLKQTDYDGNSTYSDLRPVTIDIQQNRMEVVPNPARSHTNIIFGTSEPGVATVSVFDCAGRLINTTQVNTIKGINTTELDISGYNNGVYFVVVNGTLQQYTAKFVVIR